MAESSELHVIRVSKSYSTGVRQSAPALQQASLWVRRGETMSVLGPTGCGKSSLLRIIAGLDMPDSGSVTFDGAAVDHLGPGQRGIGLVFQNYALYPHFKVHGNIAFYFRLRRWSEDHIDDKVRDTAQVMGMGFDKLLGRMPRSLSGGEKQRVALARCLSHSPRVLLLDEPFSNLDAALRLQTRGEVKRLVDRFGLTTLFVTHDQSEAVAIGHRLAIMKEGAIAQVGTFQELYQQPANQFIAGFLGTPPMNFFTGHYQNNTVQIDFGDTHIHLPLPKRLTNRLASQIRLGLGWRPEHFSLTEPHAPNSIPCQVEMVEQSVSDRTQVVSVQHQHLAFRAKVEAPSPVRPRDTIWLRGDPDHLYYFDSNGKSIL